VGSRPENESDQYRIHTHSEDLVACGRCTDAEQFEAAGQVHEESVQVLPRKTSVRAAAARFWIAQGNGARALALLEEGLNQSTRSVPLTTLLVRLLATDSDAEVRDGRRAQRLARQFMKAGNGQDPSVLGAAAAEQGETSWH